MAYWRKAEDGLEKTDDSDLIRSVLEEAREKGLWFEILAPGFRSGPTVLIDHGPKGLLFDVPPKWQPISKKLRVVFRDSSNIWHHFESHFLGRDQQGLLLAYPELLFRLERREYYRIEVPSKSRATYHFKGKEGLGRIKDICLGGMALMDYTLEVPLRDFVEEITLELWLNETTAHPPIYLTKAEVVRTAEVEGARLMGLKFHISPREEEPLLQYIRKREIEILKLRREQ
ncbi:flagellar brake protein [Thermosulfuriphilus sp.]